MRKLAITVTAAASIASLVAMSASAEERHRDETNTQQYSHRGDRNDSDWRDHNGQAQANTQRYDRSQTRNYDRSQTRNYDRNNNYNNNRNYDRGQTRSYDRNYNNNRNYDRNYGNRGYEQGRTYNNYDRNRSYNRGYGDRYDTRGRRSFSGEGRVRTFRHEDGGYRVWLEGSTYPFWIPEARWRSFPLRVGLSVRLGGWYDPLGYVDVYDVGPYAYGAPVYTSGQLQGVVESVDYYRGTLVLRDDISGNFVTTVIRNGQLNDLRPGDYVSLSGDWTRGGVFQAYRLDDVRSRY